MDGYSEAAPAAPSLKRTISASSDMAEECKMAGCTRKSWNGSVGETCCLECQQSKGATHSASCDALEESVSKLSQWRRAMRLSKAEKLTQFVCKCSNSACCHAACEADGTCCQRCPETNGLEHTKDCDDRLEKKVGDGKALVNMAQFGAVLGHIDPTCWTKERLTALSGLMDTQKDGKIRFSELISWASCLGPEKDLTAVTTGAIGVRITAAPGGGALASRIEANIPRGFFVNVAKTTTVAEISEVLALYLGVARKTLILTSQEGLALSRLDDPLEANGVLLPGPAARRKGEKLELHVSSQGSDATTAPDVLIDHLDSELWEQTQNERNQMAKHKAEIGKSLKEEEARKSRNETDVDFDEYMCRHLGVTQAKFEELKADRHKMEEWNEKGYCRADMNYLVEETSEEAKRIISDCLGRRVIRLYRNVNPTLKERYEAAKTRLHNCGRPIQREETQTQKRVSGHAPLDNLGPYDPSINEYPMWHGSGRAGVSGIASSNFDIQRCGKHGLAYGTGFYFADDVKTSVGYSSIEGSERVNSTYPKCAYMLLNRVMCGNVKHFERVPRSHEEFDMWTADCIGAGGIWAGRDAKFECIRSPGTFCWVAVHSHQIYPAYVIVYEA